MGYIKISHELYSDRGMRNDLRHLLLMAGYTPKKTSVDPNPPHHITMGIEGPGVIDGVYYDVEVHAALGIPIEVSLKSVD